MNLTPIIGLQMIASSIILKILAKLLQQFIRKLSSTQIFHGLVHYWLYFNLFVIFHHVNASERLQSYNILKFGKSLQPLKSLSC